jgi:hypothetical protein
VARVCRWLREYPTAIRDVRDTDGCCPRHSIFYPIEQYDSEVLARLADLVHQGGAEVDIHLHHDEDTAERLRSRLIEGKERMDGLGLLTRDRTGKVRYGFVHGNWALDNSHPRGRHCGVRNELAVLIDTGCYADFTMPSAPDPTQTRTINRIYYATPSDRPKSHDTGQPVRVAPMPSAPFPSTPPAPSPRLLMVQGPLLLDWHRRKAGVFPRIENGALTPANPPTVARLHLWMSAGVCVVGRPEWVFIKLHTHGGLPDTSDMLLGDVMRRFHDALADRSRRDPHFRLHYVSAREMVNIILAAEHGMTGNPGAYRDFHLLAPRAAASCPATTA